VDSIVMMIQEDKQMAYGKSIELSTIGINNDHLVRDKFNINILDSCEILWAVD